MSASTSIRHLLLAPILALAVLGCSEGAGTPKLEAELGTYLDDLAKKDELSGVVVLTPLAGGPKPNTATLGRIGSSAGGGYSTAPDLLKFAAALREHRLLSPGMTETILTGKVPMPAGLGMKARYGYGFGEVKEDGHRFVGHNGGFPGIRGQLEIGLDDGTTLVILSNLDARIQVIREKIRKMLAPTTRSTDPHSQADPPATSPPSRPPA